jgi:glycosyltransferase involved in cell wall biosynthesis
MYKILVIPSGIDACFEVGLHNSIKILVSEGFISEYVVRVSGTANYIDINNTDIIIFQRNTEYRDLLTLYYAKILRKPILYDIDDNLLKVPNIFGELSDYHNTSFRIKNIKKFYIESDYIKAGTRTLADNINKYTNKKIIPVVAFPNNNKLFSPIRHSSDGKIRFVYAASPYNYNFFFDLLADVLRRICCEYNDKVHFYFFGARPEDRIVTGNNVTYFDALPMLKFLEEFTSITADASLAPLPVNEFTLCKSNNKFREYAARGLAGVYTDMPVYSECVKEGVTGFLVSNDPDKWYIAIKRIIENTQETNKIGLAARKFAENTYTIEKYTHWMRDEILIPLLKINKTQRYHYVNNIFNYSKILHIYTLSINNTIILQINNVISTCKQLLNKFIFTSQKFNILTALIKTLIFIFRTISIYNKK